MARENITEDELMSQLRQQGLEDATHVKMAYLEGDGHFSVISRKPYERKPKQEKHIPGA